MTGGTDAARHRYFGDKCSMPFERKFSSSFVWNKLWTTTAATAALRKKNFQHSANAVLSESQTESTYNDGLMNIGCRIRIDCGRLFRYIFIASYVISFAITHNKQLPFSIILLLFLFLCTYLFFCFFFSSCVPFSVCCRASFIWVSCNFSIHFRFNSHSTWLNDEQFDVSMNYGIKYKIGAIQ